ncbi:hypothetical protein QTQ03_17120 [Micromonospora sp. WMMA1363]|uniref:hypothetical protein n=1 Tax=Micromonospora sp. WMMA1363 TaxID=3053985 RepID=UPI00259CA52B|nr:hypothetical protein [Micromonospora sp. WMMA1363]MDM4721238.1 hypothetical protein [Micromonospora sp. WMMA1363]
MTRSIRGSRRAALLLSGAATTGLLLSGCGAGQVSATADTQPSVQGVSLQTDDGAYAVRGLLLAYPGVEGYRAGANAALSAVIYNESRDPVTVTVTTDDAREVVITEAGSPAPSESPTQSPSVTPTPEGLESPSPVDSPTESPSPTPAPAGQPARIEIPPLSYVQLNTEGQQVLQLIGLNESLLSGQSVFVTFDFSNGATVTGPAPVAVPLTPAAPPSPIIEREGEYQDEAGGHGGAGGAGH